MTIYEQVLRPLLFKLPAERAHDLSQLGLRWEVPWRLGAERRRVQDDRLRVEFAGQVLESPVGLGAGLDKDGVSAQALQNFGFGYLTVGSICISPRPGNPKPRVERLVAEDALINSYGLPSQGMDSAVASLRRAKLRQPVIANVCAMNQPDYRRLVENTQPYAAAIEIALVCPNSTAMGVDFTVPENLASLLAELRQIQSRPLLLKLDPFTDDQSRAKLQENVAVALEHGVTGVTMAGTFPRRHAAFAKEYGSVSGPPALGRNLEFVELLSTWSGGRLSIKSSGGISDGRTAFQAISAGATTVDLLTAVVYQGPSVASRINRELLRLLEVSGVPDVLALRGSATPLPRRDAVD